MGAAAERQRRVKGFPRRCETMSERTELPPPGARPPMPETPWAPIPEVVRDEVLVEGRSCVVLRPGQSDRLLDSPAVRAAFAADEYMPYWADLWPAARMLAKAVLREPWESAGGAPPRALEVGCGLGLPG